MNQNQKGGGLSWSQPARPEGGPAEKQSHFKPISAQKPSSLQSPQSALPMPAASSKNANAAKPAAPVAAPAGRGTRTLAALFVGGVALGGLLGWAIFSPKNTTLPVATQATGGEAPEAPAAPAAPLAPATSVASGSATLSIAATQPAGRTVAIASAVVSAPTWVVVYDRRNNEPGNALGASLFFPEKQSGSVVLLRETFAGQTYFVGLQLDNGDRTYSRRGDAAVVQNGTPVLSEFVAQ